MNTDGTIKIPNKGVVLRWRSDGDVDVIKTGNDDIDKMPREFAMVTNAYREIYERRFDMLFEMLATNPNVRSLAARTPHRYIKRIGQIFERRLLGDERSFERKELHLLHFITEVLWGSAPRKTIKIAWQLIETYPSTFIFPIAERLHGAYLSSPRGLKRFRNELQKRPHLIALETPIIKYLLNILVKRLITGRGGETHAIQILIDVLTQYQSRLVKLLDNPQELYEDLVETTQAVVKEFITPILNHTQPLRMERKYNMLHVAAMHTFATHRSLEEAYEIHQKTKQSIR